MLNKCAEPCQWCCADVHRLYAELFGTSSAPTHTRIALYRQHNARKVRVVVRAEGRRQPGQCFNVFMGMTPVAVTTVTQLDVMSTSARDMGLLCDATSNEPV